MTIAFQCPGCGATLKVPDTMAGRRGRCPKCGTVNQLPAAGGQLQTAPSPPKSAAPSRAPKPAPAPDVADDEQEAAEEKAPRPRKGKKKRGNRTMLFVGLGCGALLLLCMGLGGTGAFLWWYLSSPIGEEMTYMPNNCEVIASIRLDQLLASDAYKQVEKEVPMLKQAVSGGEAEKEIGLQISNVERIVVGGQLGGGGQPVVAVRLKQAVKAEDLTGKIKGKSFTSAKVGSYTLYETPGGNGDGFCVAKPKLIVFGPAKSLREVLQRNKKPDLSPKLSTAMKEADFSKTIVVAAAAPKQGAGKPANIGGLPIGGNPFAGDDDVDGVVVQVKVATDVSITLVAICKDSATATVAKRKIDEGLTKAKAMPNIPPEIGKALDVKSSVSGRKVTLTTDIKVAPMIKAVKNMAGGFMGK
jgi:hypothetical protein